MRVATTVRSVTQEDFKPWLELWDGYNAFYERAGPTALPMAITQLTWQRFFDAYEPVHCLVAEQGGHLVGLVHFIFHRSTTLAGPTCYLQDLFTAPASRGQGVGRALIDAVYERAKGAGGKRVYWLTHETNTAAMKLYDQVAEKTGFTLYRKAF